MSLKRRKSLYWDTEDRSDGGHLSNVKVQSETNTIFQRNGAGQFVRYGLSSKSKFSSAEISRKERIIYSFVRSY